MKREGNRALAFVSVAASSALVLAAFTAVWLAPREAAPASAQNDTDKPSHITVRGNGSVTAKPDSLIMSVGVNLQESTIKAAQEKVSAAITAMTERLKAAGLEDKDFRTSQYTVETVMDFSTSPTGPKEGTPQQISGFRVINMLEITFRDPAIAPEVLDELVAAGANTIYSGGYTFSDYAGIQKQAYDKALQDAQDRASRLASLSGLTLGKVISISESGVTPLTGVYDKVGLGGASGPIFPGQSTVGVDLIVTYEAK
jgi:uncharacterized protein YggE